MTIRILDLMQAPTKLLERQPGLAWISPTISLTGFGNLYRFDPGAGSGRFDLARRRFESWVRDQGVESSDGRAPLAFASFTFDGNVARSVVLVPEVVVATAGGKSWLVVVNGARTDFLQAEPRPRSTRRDRPRFAGSSLPDHLWLEAVAGVLKEVESGVAEKVVLARDHALWSKERFDPHVVLANLRDRFPECYTFLIDGLAGASPELLIRRQDLTIASRALAGSTGRSEDPDEDERLGKELIASDKEQREHAAAAASVGRALGEVCRTLNRPAAPELLKLANVQHLATPFAGTLAEPHHILDLVHRLHPTAAVGGAPTATALEMIGRYEGMERGRYAGPVGYFDMEGDGEFAIALRCAELSGARARLFAGAGLVRGSVPEDELEETRLKLRAMLSALE
jgi:menaquinone-specific isochorismate synthase